MKTFLVPWKKGEKIEFLLRKFPLSRRSLLVFQLCKKRKDLSLTCNHFVMQICRKREKFNEENLMRMSENISGIQCFAGKFVKNFVIRGFEDWRLEGRMKKEASRKRRA
jgi:hypothetical protein